MKLESVRLQDLNPYENNPRINDNAVESVMNSILDRQCFTMELDEKYCDVIIQRWESLTGKKAVLLNETSVN